MSGAHKYLSTYLKISQREETKVEYNTTTSYLLTEELYKARVSNSMTRALEKEASLLL